MLQEELVENMRVLAKYKGDGQYYLATVTAAHDDGAYTVLFQGGQADDEAKRTDIKVVTRTYFYGWSLGVLIYTEQAVLIGRYW